MVKFNSVVVKLLFTVLLYTSFSSANAQNGSQCYKPLTGSGVGARAVQNGLICLLCNNGNNLDNLTDGNRNNYVEINQLVGLLQGSGVSVTDSVNTYPAGYYAGYVVDIGSSLLTIDVLNSFVVSTYNNGVFVQAFSGGSLLSSPLTGSDQGRSYIYAKTNQSFDEVRFTLNAGVSAIATLRVYYAMTFDPNCGNNENNGVCDDAIQGAGTVVTYNGGLVCALCDLINGNNIIDADKNNYALLTTPVAALATVAVGVLDEQNIYPAGYRAGFVIGPDQANVLLDANILNYLVVETYLFGTLQESQVFTSGGGLLSVSALSVSNQQKTKLGFVTTLKFNEVRLRVNQPVGASLGGLRVYYAFEEPASCNDCQEALTSDRPDPYTGTIVTGSSWTTAGGITVNLPLLPDLTIPGSLTNQGNVVNSSLTDYATYTPPIIDLGLNILGIVSQTNFRLTVDNSPSGNNGPLFPAGTFGGFVIQKEGGLLDVGVLPAITINLYNGTTLVASQSGAALASAGVLTVTGGKTIVGFKSPAAFNRIQISIDNGLLYAGGFLGSSYRIYYAFVIGDSDNDGTPDCIDGCSGGSNSTDTDGDGIPDACDNCNVGIAPPSLGASAFVNTCPSVTVDLSAVTAGNLPAGTQLTFHTGTPATGANKLTSITAVGAGTYYAAIYDPVNNCYGPTTQVVVTINACGPLAEADHTATIINTPVSGDMSTNDSDPQNSPLTYNTTASVPPSNGVVTINADGTFTYTPNNGYVGVDSFQYTVCNAAALCTTAWVHVAVSNPVTQGGANNPPLAENDYSQTLTGVPVTGNASSNDIDPDGNALSYTLISNTSNGNLVLNPDGSYSYTPNPGFNGRDTARYQVCDNGTPSKCDEALIIVEVKADSNGPSNDPPYAQNDVASTPAGTPVSGNVLENDSDPNGDPLTSSPIGSLPPGLTLNPDGSYNYNPPSGFTGTVSVPYQACDGAGKCDTATLTIVVLPRNSIDLTPTTRVLSAAFTVAEQTEREIVVDINEILGGQTNNAAVPIEVRILKSSSFTYSYDPAATTATAPFPVTVNNPDWELIANTSSQLRFRLVAGKDINGNSFSSFVIKLKVLPGAAKGTSNFNVVIISGSGNEIDFTNNQVVRILNLF
jgi:hypothetical protein